MSSESRAVQKSIARNQQKLTRQKAAERSAVPHGCGMGWAELKDMQQPDERHNPEQTTSKPSVSCVAGGMGEAELKDMQGSDDDDGNPNHDGKIWLLPG